MNDMDVYWFAAVTQVEKWKNEDEKYLFNEILFSP